jgi:iron complex outermembrane receptor protein
MFDPVTGQPVTTNTADQHPYPLASPHKVSLGATYTAPPTSSGIFSAHIDTYWQDDVVLFTQPLAGNTGSRNVNGWAYAVVNGRLQFAQIPLAHGTLDVAVFGKNLFDRKYRTFAIDFGDSLGFQTATFGDPRTFGVGLTYNFSPS